MKLKIELQQTSTRAVYLAYHNRELLGEFRGYGNTESDRVDSARKQAQDSLISRILKTSLN
jgi:hypothetical protein